MSTTVRIDEASKDLLHQIQQRTWKRTGRRPSLQETLAQALAVAHRHSDELDQTPPPMNDDEFDQWAAQVTGAHGDLSAHDIDQTVYEEDPGRSP